MIFKISHFVQFMFYIIQVSNKMFIYKIIFLQEFCRKLYDKNAARVNKPSDDHVDVSFGRILQEI